MARIEMRNAENINSVLYVQMYFSQTLTQATNIMCAAAASGDDDDD